MITRFLIASIVFLFSLPALAEQPLLLWEKEYSFQNQSSRRVNVPFAVSLDSAENIYVAGRHFLSNHNDKVFLSKIDPKSGVIWDKNITPDKTGVHSLGMTLTPEDDVVVYGAYERSNSESIPLFKMVDQSGNLIMDYLSVPRNDGGAVITSYTALPNYEFTVGYYNDFLRRSQMAGLTNARIEFKKKGDNPRGKVKLRKTNRQEAFSKTISALSRSRFQPSNENKIFVLGVRLGGENRCEITLIDETDEPNWVKNFDGNCVSTIFSGSFVDEEGNIYFSAWKDKNTTWKDRIGKKEGKIYSFDKFGNLRFSFKSRLAEWMLPVENGNFLIGSGDSIAKHSSTGEKVWNYSLTSVGVVGAKITDAAVSKNNDIILVGSKRSKVYLAKLAMSDFSKKIDFDSSLARQQFATNMTSHKSIIDFYKSTLTSCSDCNSKEFHVRSIERSKIYDPSSSGVKELVSLIQKMDEVDQSVVNAFIRTSVSSINDVPYFSENVLSACKDCDQLASYAGFLNLGDFGKSFNGSIEGSPEHRFILSKLPYSYTVSSYFTHFVNTPDDFQTFFTSILPKCAECDTESYVKRAIRSLDSNYLNIDISSFQSEPEFKFAVSRSSYEIDSKTDNDVYTVRLKSSGRTFKQDFTGNCSFSRKATRVKDAGFLDTLFTGADARKNFYDVYNCKLPDNYWLPVKEFAKSVNRKASIPALKENSQWDYYKYTGDEKIVYERSPSSYAPTEPYESSQSSSQSSSKRSGIVTSMNREGKYTIVECSIGKQTRIYHEASGKCSDNYQIGTYGCSSVIKWAKDRCESR